MLHHTATPHDQPKYSLFDEVITNQSAERINDSVVTIEMMRPSDDNIDLLNLAEFSIEMMSEADDEEDLVNFDSEFEHWTFGRHARTA